MDFSNSCIYHIRNKITKNIIYVGSTTNFGIRKKNHIISCNNITGREHHKPVYKSIRETGGMDCYEIIPVKYLSLNNILELRIEEQNEINKHSNLLNAVGAILNIEKRREYKKTYLANYFVKYKDEIREYKKTYWIKNRDKIIEQRKEKTTCECGCIVVKSSLQRHMRTKWHFKHLDNIEKV